MNKRAFLTAAVMLVACPSHAGAELQPEDAGLVPMFLETCTRPDMNADTILSGVTSSPEWTEVPSPDVDLPKLDQVPSRLVSGAYRRPDSVRQWQRTLNGRMVTLVIATLPARNVCRHVCVVFAPDIRNAMPYLDAMGEGMRALGLSGRSTDLPHYREYGTRLADRRHAHADIFSRSQAVSTARTMHLAIIYQ
ncbi:MAG: hypothetical protein KF780_05500 [Sphingomonas sp.]|nr:hypothetical protein [Sphingomonas sp.]